MPRKVPAVGYAAEFNPARKLRLTEKVLMQGARFREQIPGSNIDEGTQFDDRLFQNIEQVAPLDLQPQVLRTAQRLSMLLYRKNVRAYQMIELKKDFIMGDEITFFANEPKVQELLDEHWEQNEWEDKLEERLRTLSITGEQLYSAPTDPNDGIVSLTEITPFRIIRLNRSKKDPEKLSSVTTGKPRLTAGFLTDFGPAPGQKEKDIKKFKLIQRVKNKLIGEAFYFAVNRISGATRGLPDILSAIDWLEGLDGFVWSLLERAEMSQQVVYDLKFDGLNAKEIKEKVDAFTASLHGGGVYGHNEKVSLNLKVPELGASDAETAVRILLRQIQSGTRFAGLFYGDSDDLTRASASELSLPVSAMLTARQGFVKRMLKKIFKYQIQEGDRVGRLAGVTDLGFTIAMPKIFLRDITIITKAMVDLSVSLTTAMENEWVSKEEAGDIFEVAFKQLVPVETERSELMAEAEVDDFVKRVYEGRYSGNSKHKKSARAKRRKKTKVR